MKLSKKDFKKATLGNAGLLAHCLGGLFWAHLGAWVTSMFVLEDVTTYNIGFWVTVISGITLGLIYELEQAIDFKEVQKHGGTKAFWLDAFFDFLGECVCGLVAWHAFYIILNNCKECLVNPEGFFFANVIASVTLAFAIYSTSKK